MEARTAPLEDRALLAVTGPDAQHFLQNLVTCDVEALAPGKAAFGALLTPQGKILFEFFLLRTEDGFLADVYAGMADDLIRRLSFYKLRAKVSVGRAAPELAVHAIWGGEPPAAAGLLANDPRLPEMGYRLYAAAAPVLPAGDHEAHRIRLGMPQGGRDYPFGDTFPHEALMDQFGGVDFRKGCYVGQEVVSRMQHRGTARNRVIMVAGEDLPPQGTPVTAGGKACGTMGSSSDGSGLAMLRLDRVREALDAGEPVLAGESAVTVSIQPWAKFGWPQAGT